MTQGTNKPGIFSIGDQVKLVARTKRGRERIKQHGAVGVVQSISMKVFFNPDPGPWLMVTAADQVARWVHASRDPDFSVEEELEWHYG